MLGQTPTVAQVSADLAAWNALNLPAAISYLNGFVSGSPGPISNLNSLQALASAVSPSGISYIQSLISTGTPASFAAASTALQNLDAVATSAATELQTVKAQTNGLKSGSVDWTSPPLVAFDNFFAATNVPPTQGQLISKIGADAAALSQAASAPVASTPSAGATGAAPTAGTTTGATGKKGVAPTPTVPATSTTGTSYTPWIIGGAVAAVAGWWFFLRPKANPISSADRRNIPSSQFALPAQRKYPLIDVNHVRNAAARLSAAYRQGYVTRAEYLSAHARIESAKRRLGIG